MRFAMGTTSENASVAVVRTRHSKSATNMRLEPLRAQRQPYEAAGVGSCA